MNHAEMRQPFAAPAFDTRDRVEALWENYKRLEKAVGLADDAVGKAYEAAEPLWPKPSQRIERFLLANQHILGGHCKDPLPNQEIALIDLCGKASANPAEYGQFDDAFSLLNEWRAWKKARDAINEKHGVRHAKKAFDKAEAEMNAAYEAFIKEPATTLLGMLLKLKYAAELESLADLRIPTEVGHPFRFEAGH
jgi:hypothetical protein